MGRASSPSLSFGLDLKPNINLICQKENFFAPKTIIQQNYSSIEKDILYEKNITLDFKSDFLENLFKGILQEVFKKNFEEIVQKDVSFQNDDIATNPFIESQLQANCWINTSAAEN